jgi:hypothetical protein
MTKPDRSDLFFGKSASFEEVFPDIEDIRIEVDEMSYKKKHLFFGKDHISEKMPYCSSGVCNEGGFMLGPMLREMSRRRETEREQGFGCEGHEHFGRWTQRSCRNYFTVKVTIKYKS